MANFNVPWALNGPRRIPTAAEIATGYPCGPADRELFNQMDYAVWEELGNVVKNSGFNGSWDDGHTIAKAIQSMAMNYAIASGTANALTASLTPALLEYKAGLTVHLLCNALNTGATTLSIDGLSPLPVLTCTGAPLSGGELANGSIRHLVCTGSSWQLSGVTLINSAEFTSFMTPGTYSWIVPQGVFQVRARVWGGGGGGGGSLNIYSAATGGGGGGYCEGVFAVTPGDEIIIVIGSGGVAGIAAGGNGFSGGTSSFGTFCTALGGSGGKGASSGTAANPEFRQDGGSGGSAAGGIIQRVGAFGGGSFGTPGLMIGGTGGSSFLGQVSRISVAAAGGNGVYPGDGGGGASNNAPGGTGAPGAVELYF